MKPQTLASKLLILVTSVLAIAHPFRALAEDIDIFVAGAGGSSVANVLIVLDNTSNWASAKNMWPGGVYQGQAELKAIKTAIANLNDKVNVGLMMGNNNGGGNCCTAGYVRFAIKPMNDTNKTALQALLDNIYATITDPTNNAASSAEYSSPLFDAYKYFGGYTSPAHVVDGQEGRPISERQFGIPVFAAPQSGNLGFSALADVKAYKDDFKNYIPPDAAKDTCGGQNFIVFVGNTWPNDDAANPQQNLRTILQDVGGNTSQIPLPQLKTTTSVAYKDLGASACSYKNTNKGLADCNTAEASSCGAQYDTCSCVSGTATACGQGNYTYTLRGGITTTTVTPTGQSCTPGTKDCSPVRLSDEWTRFLYQTDVNRAAGQQNVVTYTIDVFNAKQNADQTALLYSMANAGGGKYFAAKSQAELEKALGSIFAEIQGVNSAFVSASLPVSATNRAQNVNEVYMGLFRPDPRARPLWYGNLKRYQIKKFGVGDYRLADVDGTAAINTLTGFITECATSWWTSDSGKYWENVSSQPSPAGLCPKPAGTPFDQFSDAPDGPKVEKGGVAEILRQGNGASPPTWTLNRTLRTKEFVAFNTTNSGMAAADVDFISGLNMDASGNPKDPTIYTFTDESGTLSQTKIRNTIHGGVVHSRPVAVNYISGNTVVYYGSDDGMFRAVDSATGHELWAYIPEEFYPTLPRLRQNSPLIKYSFLVDPLDVDPPPTPKNYHFDGTAGLWQPYDNSVVWLYPTMRRGGRMIYAFDVTNPASPSLKWKKGCPHLTDDTGCDDGFAGIGQTWSTPRVVKADVDGTVQPVVVVGGGYDNCEDGAPANPCSGAKGSIIYVLDAENGKILKSFPTEGRVPSDISVIDIDHDYVVDFAYVGDTRGNLYRISFGLSKTAPLRPPSNWTSTVVARTHDTNRKFLYPPALVPVYDKPSNKLYIYAALGSGDREQPLETQYPYSNPVKNRFYVFMDDVTSSSTANLDDASAMRDYTLDPGCDGTRLIPGSDKRGWVMDLTNRGEQTVTSALVVGGLIAFSTQRAIPASPDVCAPLGEARGYLVNFLTGAGAVGAGKETCGGGQSVAFAGGGFAPSPVKFVLSDSDGSTTGCIGCAPRSPNAPPAPSNKEGEEIFKLKPQKRVPVYWRQEGNN